MVHVQPQLDLVSNQPMDSWQVVEQKSYGQVVYDTFYGINSLGKARMKARELNG